MQILVVSLAAGALGVTLQQQYTLIESPDETLGWKDRVWDLAGEKISRCITVATDRGDACVVTTRTGSASTTP